MRNKIKKIRGKIYQKLNNWIGRLMSLFHLRPSSFPYLTGDGFRKMADHVYDETGHCKPENIGEGQTVFLKSDKIPEWFSQVHPQIQHRYTLLSHNSDYNVTETDLSFIDDKIICWFAQNVKAIHPRLIPLPIGVNNLSLNYSERPALFNKLKKVHPVRKNRINFGFSISTNPAERQPAYDVLSKLNTADEPGWILERLAYFSSLMTYKFVGAPDGNGNDDPRRWQAMYLGVVPIVKRTASMEYFRNLGLPLYIIDDWQELTTLSERDLAQKYEELKSGFESPALYAPYWLAKIKAQNHDH